MSRRKEPCRPAPKDDSESAPHGPAETEITTETSSATTAESQLVVLLSESRAEAESLRRELAAVRKKADADHRQLQSLLASSSHSISSKNADLEVRTFQERLARAEAALREAEMRSRIVESNWIQVDRYLAAMQHQAADSRAAFFRILEQNDGRLVLPGESVPALRREIPLRDYIAASGARDHATSPSDRSHPRSPSSSYSPRAQAYVRPLPPLTPRRAASPFQSPSDHEDDARLHRRRERSTDPPPFKRQRAMGRESETERAFRPRSPRSQSPPHRRSSATIPSSSTTSIPRKRDSPDRARHASRDYMPPPPAPAAPRPPRPPAPRAPHGGAETTRTYDARHPPLQIIQHRQPPAPSHPPTPPPPPPVVQDPADAPPHQYQHRFPLAPDAYAPRRVLRRGEYETLVFALDAGTQPYGGRRGNEDDA
ncbi:hypothetical protein C8R44DRAFT_941455 [Mycena epipterygia]|nr:hypothetical protein C8R44DRAFT_941455 [Mycena epipterygia]